MKVNFGKIFRNSLNFSVRPGRWLPIFIADLAFFSSLVALFYYNKTSLIGLFSTLGSDSTALMSILTLSVTALAIGLVYGLVKLWIMGAVIYQSYKEGDRPGKSFTAAYQRYFSLLGAVVIIIIANMAAELTAVIPYVGEWVSLILRVILLLVFYLVYQAIIVDKLGFMGAIRKSYRIFRKHLLALIVLVTLITVISFVILLVFALPILASVFSIVGQYLPQLSGQQAAGTEFLVTMIESLTDNLPLLFAGGLIFLVGSAISQVFALKAQTEFYLGTRKKGFGF